METATSAGGDWVGELVRFLRAQPGISAVRIDAAARRVAVATVGNVALDGLDEKLAATIATVEAQLAAKGAGRAPVGFSVRHDGAATVVGRDSCVTAERIWRWREMEWPEIKAEPARADQPHYLLFGSMQHFFCLFIPIGYNPVLINCKEGIGNTFKYDIFFIIYCL